MCRWAGRRRGRRPRDAGGEGGWRAGGGGWVGAGGGGGRAGRERGRQVLQIDGVTGEARLVALARPDVWRGAGDTLGGVNQGVPRGQAAAAAAARRAGAADAG